MLDDVELMTIPNALAPIEVVAGNAFIVKEARSRFASGVTSIYASRCTSRVHRRDRAVCASNQRFERSRE
jgi:hypothetical protein